MQFDVSVRRTSPDVVISAITFCRNAGSCRNEINAVNTFRDLGHVAHDFYYKSRHCLSKSTPSKCHIYLSHTLMKIPSFMD